MALTLSRLKAGAPGELVREEEKPTGRERLAAAIGSAANEPEEKKEKQTGKARLAAAIERAEAPETPTAEPAGEAQAQQDRLRPGWDTAEAAAASNAQDRREKPFTAAGEDLRRINDALGVDADALRDELNRLSTERDEAESGLSAIVDPWNQANAAAQSLRSQVEAYETKLGMLQDTIENSADPEERLRAQQESKALDLYYQKAQRAAERYSSRFDELNTQFQQLAIARNRAAKGLQEGLERYSTALSLGDKRAAYYEQQAKELRENADAAYRSGMPTWEYLRQAENAEARAEQERQHYAEYLARAKGEGAANRYLSGIEEGNRQKQEAAGFGEKVLNTVAGSALNFLDEAAMAPLLMLSRIMEIPDDIAFAVTKDERFRQNRDSDALRASDPFKTEIRRMQDNAGGFGGKIVGLAGTAGSMMALSAFGGMAAASLGGSGVISTLENIANSSPLLTSTATRYAARMGAGILADVVANPGNAAISASAGINAYSTALDNGAGLGDALVNGIMKAAAEYFSNKLFTGTPFEDAPFGGKAAEKGYVTQAIEKLADKLGASKVLAAFNQRTGGKFLNALFDKAGEGLEEVVTAILDPVIDYITFNPNGNIDIKLGELIEEFEGGVLLSLLMSGGEAVMKPALETANIREQLIRDGLDRETARKWAPKLRKELKAIQDAADAVRKAAEAEDARIAEAPETAGSVEAQAERQNAPKTVLQQKAEKYARDGRLSGQDARDILSDPEAMQALIDAGLITGREKNDSAGRKEIVRAAEEYAAREAENRETQESIPEETPGGLTLGNAEAQEEAQGLRLGNAEAQESRGLTPGEESGPPVPGQAETPETVQETENNAQIGGENAQNEGKTLSGRERLAAAIEKANAGQTAQEAPQTAQEASGEAPGSRIIQKALARQRAKDAGKAQSLRDIGFNTASEAATVKIRAEENWDAEEKTVGQALRDLGYEPTFTAGIIHNADGDSVPFLLEGNKLAIRADHRSQSIQTLAEQAIGQSLNIDTGARNQAMEDITRAREAVQAERQTEKKTAEKPKVTARAQAAMDSARAAGASEENIALVGRLADILNRDIRCYNDPGMDGANTNGYTENGVLYINAGADMRTIAWVVGHELTHNVEASKYYKALKKLAQRELGLNWSLKVQSKIQTAERVAQKLGNDSIKVDREGAEREVVADFFADRLLSDEAAIRRVCEYEPVTARNIRDYIKNLLNKLGGREPTLERAVTLYNKALKDVAAKAQAEAEGRLQLRGTPEAQKQESGLRLGGERQFSVDMASELYRTETDFTEPMPADEFREKIKAESRAESYFPKGLSEKFMKAIARKGTFNRTKLYRGIDAAEMDFLMENKYLQSNGSYNFQNQQGQTLADEDPGYALSYATGFAPKEIADKHYKDGMPSYLVEFLNSPNLNVSKNDVQESYTYDQIGQDYITRIFEIEYDPETQKDMVRDVTEEMRAHLPDMGKGLAETAHGRPMFFRDKTTGTIVYAVQGADGWENGKYISEKDPSMTWSYEQMDSPVFSKHAPAMLGVSGNEADLEAMEVGPNGELVPEKKAQFSAEDEEYLAAVEAGDMETARRMVDEAAEVAMPDSKVRDDNGKLKHMYHGTSTYGFTKFDYGKRKFGLFGTGFYFTDDPSVAQNYTQKGKGMSPGVYDVYLNITNPMDMDDRADLPAWEKAFREADYDESYLTGNETNEECFLALKEYCQDMEMYRHEAEDAIEGVISSMGYDGITHIGGGRYSKNDETRHRVYIAFEQEQIKSAEPVTRDNQGKVIGPTERFDPEKADIRWSAEDAQDSDDEYRQTPGTPALEKLGIRLAGSKGRYHLAEQLLERDRAAKELMKATKKAEKKLKATKAEREFAAGIAAGIYEERDIPVSMNKDTVTTLADYYAAEESFKANMLAEVRGQINAEYQDEAEELLSNVDHFKKLSMLMLNERTPDRTFRAMFGPKQGKAIFDWLIRPVQMNEAAKTRWHQEQLDKVRKFTDSKGKTRELTREESALTMLVMEGKAAAAAVADMEKKGLDAKGIRNAAENIRNGADAGDAAWEFGLKDKERELAKNYATWMDTQEKLKTADSTIIEAAAEKYSEIFDDFYDAINDFLVAHGYEPIGYIKGYAPHMQPEETQNLLEKAFDKMGISLGNEKAQGLPASIAGETAYFKPNKRWDPYFLHRTGTQAEYDIEKAYQSYVGYLSDILFHTDDIMRVRNMERMIRRTYASDEIKENLDWIQEIRNSPSEERLGMLRDAGKIGKTTILSGSEVNDKLDEWEEEQFNALKEDRQYNNLVMWLSNYANILAGKQSFADRGWEYSLGRNSLNFANRLQAAFQRSLVAGSLTSALNQTAQLPMIQAELGDRWYYAALKDILTGQTRGFWKDSDFLTGKHGVDMLYTDNYDKFISALFKPSTAVDYIVSTTAVRGAFLKAIHQGQSYSEAMRTADDFGRKVMGSREKGTRPLAYESKGLFSRMIHMFQVEAANSWDHIASDLPYEIKEIARTQGKPKAARTLAALLVKALLSTFLLNRLTEEIYGGTPAPFDVIGLAMNFVASGQGMTTNRYLKTIIDNGLEKLGSDRIFGTEDVDAEFDVGKGLEELGYNVMNDVPLLRNLAGVLGLGDQTVPLPGAGGEFADAFTAAGDLIKEGADGQTIENLIRAAAKLGAQFVPAGRQLTKTGEGVEAVIRGGSYSKKGKLQYPIDSTADQIRAILFGKNATAAAQEHWASGESTMSEKQTEMVSTMRGWGMSGAEARKVIRDIGGFEAETDPDTGKTISGSKKAKVVDYIDGLKLTSDQKDQLYLAQGYAESGLEETPWHAKDKKGGSSGKGKTYAMADLSRLQRAPGLTLGRTETQTRSSGLTLGRGEAQRRTGGLTLGK